MDSGRKTEDTDQCKCFQTKLDICIVCDGRDSVPNSVKPKPCHDKKRHNATGNAKINQKNLIKVRFATVDNDKCKSSRNLCFVNAKYKVNIYNNNIYIA